MDQSHLHNGEVIFTVFIAAFVFLLLVSFIVFFILIYQRRRSAYVNEINAVKAKFQETLLQAQLEIKEQTLQHLAYELHDNLGQIASLIKINLNTFHFGDAAKADKRIEDIKELVKQLITDIKSLSVSLNGDRVIDHGIIASIETEITRLNKIGRFKAELSVDGSLPILGPNRTIILYRMVQEMINNIIKHSEANHITIAFQCKENLVTLVCADDGLGFDLNERRNTEGSGLLNLKNRAKLINAAFSIDSSPETGTKIVIELPV